MKMKIMNRHWPGTQEADFAGDLMKKDTRTRFGAGFWQSGLLLGWLSCAWGIPATAQTIVIRPPAVSNGTVLIGFPARLDSYYLLEASPTLSTPFGPVNAVLGNDGGLDFAPTLSAIGSMFYRVEQLPLTSTNDIIGDGIADGFKLQHSLPVFGPSEATVVPLGDVRTWLQIYQSQTNLAALPLAYFPASSYTVVANSASVTVPVSFTKPYTGRLTYHLTGTAIPSASGVTGDYIQPAGNVFVDNASAASISISLVQEPDVEINRSIVIAISAPPVTNQTYTITTNSCVTTVQIVQSTLGVFVGTLTFTNGPYMGAQSVKMALRPGSGGSTVAFFDVTGNAFLGNTFSVPAQANTNGFQLNGDQFANAVTNTPWARPLTISLSFDSTVTNGTTFTTPVTTTLVGLTASRISYSGSGTLNLTRIQ
jgi:hypothetical protein